MGIYALVFAETASKAIPGSIALVTARACPRERASQYRTAGSVCSALRSEGAYRFVLFPNGKRTVIFYGDGGPAFTG
jgi:hypothetical protein